MQKTPIPPALSGPGYERIRNALETILASDKFLSAPQMSAFLRYVVVQAATGNKDRIKAYTVAVDALGKPETFDPQNDPVVRVLAGRLRSTLSAYYEQHPDADIIIEMKPGSYVPTFILREIRDQSSQGYDSANAGEDAAAAPGQETGDAMILSLKLAHAANNQSTLNNSAQPVSDAGKLDTTHQRWNEDNAVAGNQPPFAGSTISRRAWLSSKARRFPKLTAAVALFGALLIGMYADALMKSLEPAMLASKPSDGIPGNLVTLRTRPDSLSLFFSAPAPDNTLVNQVNTTMSSVFSKSENIRVYRLLRSTQVPYYWPEDYHVSLNALALPDETQVSVQLVDAQTGRIAHSEILHLSADAPRGLSSEDLKTITSCSQRLLSDDGPLVRDYKDKTLDTGITANH